jgi:hyperosmotically inducible protein
MNRARRQAICLMNGSGHGHESFTLALFSWIHGSGRLIRQPGKNRYPHSQEFAMKQSLIRTTVFAAALLVGGTALPIATVSAQDSNQTVAGKTTDAWITTKVKSELATTKGIKSTDITVETNEGVVSLSGTVASAAQKTRVEKIAKKVKGVKSVAADGLTVGAASN